MIGMKLPLARATAEPTTAGDDSLPPTLPSESSPNGRAALLPKVKPIVHKRLLAFLDALHEEGHHTAAFKRVGTNWPEVHNAMLRDAGYRAEVRGRKSSR